MAFAPQIGSPGTTDHFDSSDALERQIQEMTKDATKPRRVYVPAVNQYEHIIGKLVIQPSCAD